jgi:hypothetical protein
MKQFFMILLMLLGIFSSVSAELVFFDGFEDDAITNKAWKNINAWKEWKQTAEFVYRGSKALMTTPPPDVEIQSHHTLSDLKIAYIEAWFYDMGWDNKEKTDQQYLYVGNAGDESSSSHWCQIGQTGNPSYDGHYAIFAKPPGSFFVSKASSTKARWVKFSFILKSKKAVAFIDDKEEQVIDSWDAVRTIAIGGVAKNPPDLRGGTPTAYWDDVIVTDTGEPFPFGVLLSTEKLATTWGKLKKNTVGQ